MLIHYKINKPLKISNSNIYMLKKPTLHIKHYIADNIQKTTIRVLKTGAFAICIYFYPSLYLLKFLI